MTDTYFIQRSPLISHAAIPLLWWWLFLLRLFLFRFFFLLRFLLFLLIRFLRILILLLLWVEHIWATREVWSERDLLLRIQLQGRQALGNPGSPLALQLPPKITASALSRNALRNSVIAAIPNQGYLVSAMADTWQPGNAPALSCPFSISIPLCSFPANPGRETTKGQDQTAAAERGWSCEDSCAIKGAGEQALQWRCCHLALPGTPRPHPWAPHGPAQYQLTAGEERLV